MSIKKERRGPLGRQLLQNLLLVGLHNGEKRLYLELLAVHSVQIAWRPIPLLSSFIPIGKRIRFLLDVTQSLEHIVIA